MTDILVSTEPCAPAAARPAGAASPMLARAALLSVIAVALAAGFLANSVGEAGRAAADPDLTRLLRAMTGLKLLMAAGAAGAVMWRLGSPVTAPWLAAYAAGCGAMFGGPGLIWGMAHLGLGALLLHAGLAATILLVWRDPVVANRLEAPIAARRAALRTGGGRDRL